ncbi:MAG: transglycosylase SLT domain-containing protein [Desulfobacteraceae bacterium]|nr:transglycosylase SLT domain-containing protein [Desulfobacteraceae bacterium]
MTASCWCGVNRYLRFFKPIICSIVFLLGLSFVANPLLFAATRVEIQTNDPDFPMYPSIKPNVDFWIDIFTKYSKSQGVIHHTKNLDIIYEVVRLDASETYRANKKNRKIKKAVAKKYKNILLNLSKGKKQLSAEEKKVAALFGPKAKLSDFKNAAFSIRCQTGLKKQFKEGLTRSGSVMDVFKKTFRSYGLPVDLVYLPCVESSYNFKAYSKFGAAGIWQFTHATGRQYMKIGYVVDERRDPHISTHAAARLLKKNYADLKEWPMAITAYNHGLAGMRRAKRSKGSYERIFKSYRSRSFKFASRNFYSEFLAARIVAKNSKKYFGDIQFHRPLLFQVIKTKGYLPVKKLSESLNISVQAIKSLNPALRKPVYNGQKYIPKGYTLKLPKTVAMAKANKLLASLYHKKQKPSRFHRVQKGDTAGAIARLHSVKLHDLILANSLSRRATIYIGQNLRIPVKDEIILAKNKRKTAKSKKTTAQKEIVVEKTAEIKVPPQPLEQAKPIRPIIPTQIPERPKVAGKPKIIEIQAKPVSDVASINPNVVTSNLQVLQSFQKGNRLIGIIKVEAEETLGHYADWLKIPTQEIRTLNQFNYGAPISIDQKIKISMRKKTIQEFEEQRYEFHKEIEEDFFESFSIQGLDIYEVKNGDSIWSLCLNELEIPVWLLKKYNPDMNFNTLMPSQKIKYPIISKHQEI